MEIASKSILVTGGGSGIGRALALALAAKGAHLVLAGRRAGPLEDVAALAIKSGGKAAVVPGSVADSAARASMLAAAVRAYGGLDILVNNAGAVRAGRLETLSEGEIRTMIEVDLTAPILFAREALPLLRKSGNGLVVNITSGMALIGMPFYGVYAAAKAGLSRFGEAMHREWLDEGVRVLTAYPVATETPMMATSKASPEMGFPRENVDEVAYAFVAAIEADAFEVRRGGEARQAMLAINSEDPRKLDDRFRSLKPKLEDAVRGHSAL